MKVARRVGDGVGVAGDRGVTVPDEGAQQGPLRQGGPGGGGIGERGEEVEEASGRSKGILGRAPAEPDAKADPAS
ncbi:hypothetical protein GCM10010340_67260 [Streptomyces griseoloalbus]|nr:hypothetical protein GCM10010340_67260 [Streptomyces albaduncus]